MVVDFTPKRNLPPLLFIGAGLLVLVLAGVGVGAYFWVNPDLSHSRVPRRSPRW